MKLKKFEVEEISLLPFLGPKGLFLQQGQVLKEFCDLLKWTNNFYFGSLAQLRLKTTIPDGWLAGRPGGGGIEINTNSAHQLGLSWDLAGLSLATRRSFLKYSLMDLGLELQFQS